MKIEANLGQASWARPNGKKGPESGRFRPKGEVVIVGERHVKIHEQMVALAATENPAEWESDEPMLAARLFVGFNVGQKPTYEVDDLLPIVLAVREGQGHAPDASFLLQKGIYTSMRDKSIVEEDGAQVIVLNLDGAPQKTFERDMVELGEIIAKSMQQETVIVEIQKGGITTKVVGVVP